MNREMLHRMKKAGEYQRKAIRALFPEEMSEHLDVIEGEMKMMLMELATDWLKDCKKDDIHREEQESKAATKVKRVNIM